MKPDNKSENICRYDKLDQIEDHIRVNSIISTPDYVIYPQGPNNYIPQNKKIKILILIDITTFNIHSYNIYLLLQYLKNDPSSYVFNIRYTRDKYSNPLIQFLLQLNGKTYFLSLVDKTATLEYPNVLLIKYPDTQVLLYLDNFLSRMMYHIKDVEFAFDFEGADNNRIRQKLFPMYYLKWSTKASQLSLRYPTTSYSNNIRTSPRGMKVYAKQRRNGRHVVRMEATYRRRILTMKNINVINDLINLDMQKIASDISFRTFDYDRFLNLHLKQLRYGLDVPVYKYMKKPMTSGVGLLVEAAEILIDIKAQNFATGALRSKASIGYDLHIQHPFEEHFKAKLVGKSFLTGDYILVDEAVFFA